MACPCFFQNSTIAWTWTALCFSHFLCLYHSTWCFSFVVIVRPRLYFSLISFPCPPEEVTVVCDSVVPSVVLWWSEYRLKSSLTPWDLSPNHTQTITATNPREHIHACHEVLKPDAVGMEEAKGRGSSSIFLGSLKIPKWHLAREAAFYKIKNRKIFFECYSP